MVLNTTIFDLNTSRHCSRLVKTYVTTYSYWDSSNVPPSSHCQEIVKLFAWIEMAFKFCGVHWPIKTKKFNNLDQLHVNMNLKWRILYSAGRHCSSVVKISLQVWKVPGSELHRAKKKKKKSYTCCNPWQGTKLPLLRWPERFCSLSVVGNITI